MAESTDSGALAKEPHQDFFIVGIGASAGGISALRQFFSHVEPDIGIAFVVILHLSPQHESNLPALIQNQTALRVTQVTENVTVEPNHVYVIPPSKYLVMMEGKIRLTEPERPRSGHASIDLFLRTLGDAYGKDAIAILLSGTGADGSLGLGRIKEEGGFVIAQEPEEAEYPDMPRAAIDTGLVDLVLPVSEMPGKLRALRDGRERLQIPAEPEEAPPPELDEAKLREVLNLVRLRTNNDFSHYKRPSLLRRVARRMQVHELTDLQAYLNFLRERPDEISALLRDLLISVTNFFRDHDAFDFLEKQIIPRLFHGKGPDDQVRVWSAGCATGEEAYSLTMLLAEYAARREAPEIKVFANDIDEKAISEARDCHYPPTIALDVSPERLRRFFTKDGERYQIKKELRELVLFAPHNVLRDPPFSGLDLISCRNLLIYLNRDMQERVLGIFHFALREDGYLFLGASETADVTPALYAPVDKKWRVYGRRKLIGSNQFSTELPMAGKWQAHVRDEVANRQGRQLTAGELHQEVVDQIGPPSILINEEYDVVHISARAVRYLRMAPGEPTRNLLKLIHPDLRLDLRAALLETRARGEGDGAESRRTRVNLDGEAVAVNLTVRPVLRRPESARGFFLIIFDESVAAITSVAEPARGNLDFDLMRQLEQNLQHTKDQLRITIEQYETSTEELRASNEELQAINEELRSASEELETSKEELQSVNEELTTVNQEYKEKIEEVSRANNDLQNLMASTDIGTIFLDRGLRIGRYTPRAQQLFNITPMDIGRPLEHFTHKLDYASLTRDAEEVLLSLQMAEREVRAFDDRWYLARLIPYRTLERKIDGVVLTFVDITNRKRDEEQLRRQAATLREQTEILNLAEVLVHDRDNRIVLWSAGCERLYGYSGDEAVGRNAHELLKTEFPQPLTEIDAQLEKTGQWEGDLVHSTRSADRIMVASHWVLCRREGNEPDVILEVVNDITARRKAEEALRQADRNKDRFLAMLAHELRNPLGAILSSVKILDGAENLKSQAPERARAVIQRQLQELVRLVDDLLDIERLSHGKIALIKTPIPLADVIQSAVEACQPLIDSNTHKFKVTLSSEPIYVNADLTRLVQVVSNLLNNAFKYTPSGGQIDLMVERMDNEAVIRVRDTGLGISTEMLPRLFDMYSQGEARWGAEAKGLGIGLALVRWLVEMHGGSVKAFSEGSDKGSELTVRLPTTAPPAAQPRTLAGPREKSHAASSRKVLLVDDNRDSVEALGLLLESAGHDVRIAGDGPSAIEMAAQFRPDVAVVDIGLPSMDGFEAARRLREKLPGVVLVALSGWPVDRIRKQGDSSAFEHYLRKPFEMQELTDILEDA